MPVIGYLSSRSPDDTTHLLAGFRQGLADGGFIERQNVTIEYRWALGQYDRLPELATELARLPVVVAATSTIPIVFATGTDPVKTGLVASYNRPGGNGTGINFLTVDMEAKRLGLLHELMPQAKAVAFLYNPLIIRFSHQCSVAGNVHGFLLSKGVYATIDFPGAIITTAYDIDDQGDIVGGWVDSSGHIHGYLRTPGP